jgi:hypothetical protein
MAEGGRLIADGRLMNTRPVVAACFLLLAGCRGGPDVVQPEEIDLTTAQRLESEGKALEAIVEHARLVQELTTSGRTDWRAHVAWGRILGSLHRMKAGEKLAQADPETRKQCAALEAWCTGAGPGVLSTGAAGHWSQVLSLGAEPPILAEAAGSIADLFAEKIEDPALRRGRIEQEGALAERLYRRSLAQAAAEYARYAMSRAGPKSPDAVARASRLSKRLAREIREFAGMPRIIPARAARWLERAAEADAQALEGEFPLSNDLRQAIEIDTAGLLKAAIDHVNKANDLLSRRADPGEILESLERALRNFVAARECLVEPSTLQKKELDVMPIAADALRSLAFEN